MATVKTSNTTSIKAPRTKTTKAIDAKSKIKPRGLWGLFEGRIHLNGTDEEVFNLGLQ